jgi:hypothetical protein
MKAVSLAGFVVAVLALSLAIAVLVSMPEEPDEVMAELDTLRSELDVLSGLVAEASSGTADVAAEIGKLNARVAELSAQTGRLAREIAAVAKEPRAPAAARLAEPRAAVDEEAVRELVRDELREQFERLRRRGPGQGRRTTPEDLRGRVGLDEENAERVAEMLEREGERIRDIWRGNRGGGREENVELMREVQRETEAKIAEILTPDQMQKYREMREAGHQGRGRGRGPGGHREHGRGRPEGGEREREPAEEQPVF